MTRGNRITRDAHFGLDETTCSTHPDRAKREPDHWRGLHRHGRHRSAFSGVGNFSGVAGEEVYDIANNQLTGAAGIAPVHAASASDLVLRNANTGAFEVYDIAGNQLIGAASLGQVGLDWQLGGFAADPPTLSGAFADTSNDHSCKRGRGSAAAGQPTA